LKKLLICIAAISIIAIPSYMAYRSWALDTFVIKEYFGIPTIPKSLRVVRRDVNSMGYFAIGPDVRPPNSWYTLKLDADEFDQLRLEQYREDPPQYTGELNDWLRSNGVPTDKSEEFVTPTGHKWWGFEGKATFRVEHHILGQPSFDGGRLLVDESKSPRLKLYFGTTLPLNY
jgi:hypothetical protein